MTEVKNGEGQGNARSGSPIPPKRRPGQAHHRQRSPRTEVTEATYDENNRLSKYGSTEYKYDSANNPTKEGSSENTYNEGNCSKKAPE